MVISSDTNVLVRVSVEDDPEQTRAAQKLLRSASTVVVSTVVFCEVAWVLRGVYKFPAQQIVGAINKILALPNVVLDRDAVEAGLEVLREGGDFADGVIAYEGRRLGAETFVSFDRKAVTILKQQGHEALLLS